MSGRPIPELEVESRYILLAPLAEERRVLDVGGDAASLLLLAEAGAAELTAASEQPDTLTAQLLESEIEGVEVIPTPTLPLSFENDAFDLIICHDLGDWVSQDEAWIAEVRRVLSPDGFVALSLANPNGLRLSNLYGQDFSSGLSYEDAFAKLSETFGVLTVFVQSPMTANLFYDLESTEEDTDLVFDRSLLTEDIDAAGWYVLVFGPTHIHRDDLAIVQVPFSKMAQAVSSRDAEAPLLAVPIEIELPQPTATFDDSTRVIAQLEEERSDLAKRLQTLQIQLDEAFDTRDRLAEDLGARDAEIEQLQTRVSNLEAEHAELSLVVPLLRARIKALKIERRRQQDKINHLRDQQHKLQDELEFSGAYVPELEQELAGLRVERDGLVDERDNLAKERDSLAKERDSLANERNSLANERDNVANERDNLANELSSERDRLNREKDEAHQVENAAIAQRDEAYRAQAEAIAQRDEAYHAKDAAIAQRDIATHEWNTATQEREAAQKERDAAFQVRDALAQEKDAAFQARDVLVQERDAAFRARDVLVQERDAAFRARDVLAQERDAAFQARDVLAQERDGLGQERDSLAQERDSLAQERDSLAQERDSLAQERDSLAQERDSLAQERDSLAQEFNATARERDAMAQQNDELIAERDNAAQEIAELARKKDAVASEREELASQREALAQERDHIAAELGSTASQRDEITAELSQVRDQISSVTSDLELARRQIQEVADERDNGQQEIHSLREETERRRSETEQLVADLDMLRSRVASLKEERQREQEKIGALRQKLLGIETEHESATGELQLARERISTLKDERSQEQQNLANLREKIAALEVDAAALDELPMLREQVKALLDSREQERNEVQKLREQLLAATSEPANNDAHESEELETLKQELENHTKDRLSLESQIKDLLEEVHELRQAMASQPAPPLDEDSLEQQDESGAEALSQERVRNEELMEELARLRNRVGGLESENQSLSKEIQRLTDEAHERSLSRAPNPSYDEADTVIAPSPLLARDAQDAQEPDKPQQPRDSVGRPIESSLEDIEDLIAGSVPPSPNRR